MKSSSKIMLVLAAIASVSAFATSYTTITLNQEVRLPECGGTIVARASRSGKHVMLDIKNTKACSNFDVVAANGAYDPSANIKIPADEYGNGRTIKHIELSDRLYDFGANAVTVKIQSDSGKHMDYVTIRFNDWRF